MINCNIFLLSWIFLITLDFSICVNVHFENKDGGFFIKQQVRQHLISSSTLETSTKPDLSNGVPISVEKFTLFQRSQPISVRATYGPFSTKQTVPAKYIVPDPLPVNTSGPAIDFQDQTAPHLDMSAHIVRNEIPRDSPNLRVLFHTGTDPGGRRQVLLARHHQKVCIVLHASMNKQLSLHAACSPDGEDGVCLAQITIPSFWWNPLPPADKNGKLGKPVKTPPRLVQVAYSVLEPWPDEGEGCHPKMQVQPSIILGHVLLTPATGAYKELKLADPLTMLIPLPPLYPMSRIYLPILVDKEKAKLMTAIVVKARLKSGVRFLEALPSEGIPWNTTVDYNPRHTSVTVTLVRKEAADYEPTVLVGEVMELFTWLIEMGEDSSENFDNSKIVWSARYEPHQELQSDEETRKDGKKLITRFEIQKDDIQAVVPISKNWEVLNTAVLTGIQVSQAMKVFIVSQAGKAADVTFQSSCHSEDETVLKVSSSCGSVYVDGSEARGSVNGSVLVKYGSFTGLAQFTVWMPEFPLELSVADTRLSQIKSWRTPDFKPSISKSKLRKKRAVDNSWDTPMVEESVNVLEKPVCKLRYQQTSVDVYAHFLASDHSSGRTNYFINRRTLLRITDLVLPWLRVSDPRIASLHGRILQGRSVGRTEVQVLSPITSRVYGSREIRVGNDKVALSKLYVQVISGLQLNISPDSSLENVYVAETGITRKLTAQYQEGLLDIELEFSDGQKTALRDITDSDYHLIVESLDPDVVAFAPMVASHHPRVIAIGEGSGDLLQVSLLLSEECRNGGKQRMKAIGPLASAAANIIVDFSTIDLPRPDIVQNDGGNYGNTKGREYSDLQDIPKVSSPILGGHSESSDVEARPYHSGNKGIMKQLSLEHSTPLEISMYVLLTAFCCAIMVFVLSCVIYASKYKPLMTVSSGMQTSADNSLGFYVLNEPQKPQEYTTNAHDWVWLGRASVPSKSVGSSTNMRIIKNPLNTNYSEPDDSLTISCNNENGKKDQENDKTKIGWAVSASDCDDDLSVWNKPTPPVPIPSSKPTKSEIDDEYRPPVPPHRKVKVQTTSSTSSVNEKSRSSTYTRKDLLPDTLSNNRLSNEIPNRNSYKNMKLNESFQREEDSQIQSENEESLEFVQFYSSPNSNRTKAEVKIATINDNPSLDSCKSKTKKLTESPCLDELELNMDYHQILHYFENLKESNA